MTGFTGFQPKKRGTYMIEVIQDGTKFQGSPFQIQVGDNEVCTPSKVKCTGHVREGLANMWNEIIINVHEAGQFHVLLLQLGVVCYRPVQHCAVLKSRF